MLRVGPSTYITHWGISK